MRGLILILLCFASGCGAANRAAAPWKTIFAEGPWFAPGQRAVLESREYWGGPMAAGVTAEERFRTTDARHLDVDRTARTIVSAFEKKGMLQTWSKTGAHIDGRAVVLAPFRFHVVSIFPVIVLVTPHDFGSTTNRSTFDLVGTAPKGALSQGRILNHIEIGTVVPFSPALYWCSPDLDIALSPVTIDSRGEFAIEHASVIIVGRRDGDSFVIERKR